MSRQRKIRRQAKKVLTAKNGTRARQRFRDGKVPASRTAKKQRTAKAWALPCSQTLPCRQTSCTAKGPLPCASPFAVPQYTFFFCFSNYFISSTTYIYFVN